MSDRGMIKWQPFNSVINTNQVINSIIKEKQKIEKPILSKEQQTKLEEKIIEAYYEQIPIEIQYYQSGHILTTKGIIKNINNTYKKIFLDNQKILLFQQIIKIT